MPTVPATCAPWFVAVDRSPIPIGKPASTIGFERRLNRAFATEDREPLVQLMRADIPAPPREAAAIRSANLEAIRSTVGIRS